ncbi:CehA/McbA family metallohydrolase [Pelagicoccus mobilis]|uniref:CehA/McbA family metallohydrolase n=1 Tax=Pelagicoccus mobilis TaxID=415221 RepID=A0A934VRD8_9BACT|nr:CehA/McbA family metallohydrolase [Pelagicoccus mobilis]MBK1877414.1 CehA/McbA family metallohydrolase [Pelagicoccus mobilis]
MKKISINALGFFAPAATVDLGHLCRSVIFLRAALLCCAAIVALVPTDLRAHGAHYEKPTAEQAASISDAIPGAPEFARALTERGSGLLAKGQFARLDQALHAFQVAQDIEAGRHPEAGPKDAAFNRSEGERILCEVLESAPQVLAYDFRPGVSFPDAHAVVPFDAQAGCLLLKTKTGDRVKRFVVQSMNMAQERYDGQYEIPVDEDGIIYVFQDITEPPSGDYSTHIAFKKIDATTPFQWHAIKFDMPESGQLRFRVEDGNGESVPAMVRLTALPSGRMWAPSGSMDLKPMIEDVTGTAIDVVPGFNIYGPGRAFDVRIPGEFTGHYWVVPDEFEMELPVGKWEVTVFRGIETVPVREIFEIKSGGWTDKVVKLERWVDMAESGWYSGDDHVHSRMRSSEDAEKLMAFTRAMDVRVSNILEMGDPQRTYYSQRGFGEAFRIEEDGYFLIPGQEDPRSILGHNIGMNITEMARDLSRYLQLDWIADQIHQQGGLFGQTHVGQNACEAHRGMALMVPREMYDFYSIMQGSLGTQLFYDFLDLGYKLTGTAGSDMPYAGSLGNVRFYAYLGNEPFTADAWFDAISKGHTFVTNGPMLEFSVNGQMAGEEIQAELGDTLKIDAKAWGLPGDSEPVSLEVVRLSEVIKRVSITQVGGGELSTSFEVPVDGSGWIALRAYGLNGSVAHTTPVYVSQGGKRHWNVKRVRDIVGQQLAILDEIDGVVAAAEDAKSKGRMSHIDFWAIRSVEQASQVRERTEITRRIYRKLLAELDEQLSVPR